MNREHTDRERLIAAGRSYAITDTKDAELHFSSKRSRFWFLQMVGAAMIAWLIVIGIWALLVVTP